MKEINMGSKSLKKVVDVLFGFMLMAGILAPGSSSRWTVFAEEDRKIIVAAGSDYQYPNEDSYGIGQIGNDGGAVIMSRVAEKMQEAGISGVDGFLCAGDYDYDLNRNADDTAAGIASMKAAALNSGLTNSNTEFVLVQGNHDPMSTAGGTSESGNNDPISGAYGVFVINERDYQWAWTGIDESATIAIADLLQSYCDEKIENYYTAPIFVVSHLPLHYSMRTNYDGDCVYARHIFDVLNDAAAQGLNIIYLFGHNHSNGWDDYLGGANIFLAPGDQINISDGEKSGYTTETLNFVYMNAGYLGYYKHQNTETEAVNSPFYDISDLTMSCFVISDDMIEITRYNNEGETILKDKGIYNRYKYEHRFKPGYPVNEEIIENYAMILDR